ncbi:hypothetical protein BX281_8502 [Streptomyces sp. Ag82_O1-15]|nr:hypothetical protein BX281_8502 [Streptomyces sp. Ag82_O1-15]
MPHVNGDLLPVLESVDSLQRAWQEVVKANDPAFQEARRRSLRRHAIETGIIERLYEVDWGVTEASSPRASRPTQSLVLTTGPCPKTFSR